MDFRENVIGLLYGGILHTVEPVARVFPNIVKSWSLPDVVFGFGGIPDYCLLGLWFDANDLFETL
jgi:hypothetical protein